MNIGLLGISAALALAAVGSAIGMGTAGMAAIGAWKKCYLQNRDAPFLLLAFAGAPLTQTIYGLILMNALAQQAINLDGALVLGIGVLGGIAMAFSAVFQGKAAAVACDAFAETNKGFASNIIILGLVETVALFVMVFLMSLLT